MKGRRLVVLGDSLSMPRPDEGVEYEDTYPYILYKRGYEVLCRSRRSNDTKTQNAKQNILDDLIFLRPNILVIHLGIVDCAPRLFTRYESRMLSLLPNKIRNTIISGLSKRRYFFTKIREISYVDSRSFILNVRNLIFCAKEIVDKIIIIKINKTNQINDSRSFNFIRKIDLYNELLRSLCAEDLGVDVSIIDPNNCMQGLLGDGIHINKIMHDYLANRIQEIIASS